MPERKIIRSGFQIKIYSEKKKEIYHIVQKYVPKIFLNMYFTERNIKKYFHLYHLIFRVENICWIFKALRREIPKCLLKQRKKNVFLR